MSGVAGKAWCGGSGVLAVSPPVVRSSVTRAHSASPSPVLCTTNAMVCQCGAPVFQPATGLLSGYVYASKIPPRLSPRAQAVASPASPACGELRGASFCRDAYVKNVTVLLRHAQALSCYGYRAAAAATQPVSKMLLCWQQKKRPAVVRAAIIRTGRYWWQASPSNAGG